MSLYNALTSLRRLVGSCEEAISEGKLALSTGDADLASKFVSSARVIAVQAPSILTEAKNLIEKHDKEDKLVKYISVYYRTLVLVSVPYIILILKDLADLLSKRGHVDKVNEVQNIIEKFEVALDTLK
ncbi:MAG: hypothetical protein QXH02_05355 [Desulfurococcaceae archaeon]